jgi:hypothetical protein
MQLVTLIGAQDHPSERAAKGSFSLARAQTGLPAVCTLILRARALTA